MKTNIYKSIRRSLPIKWEATGNERVSGLPISLTYFGHNFGLHTTAGTIFEPGYRFERTGRRWLGTSALPITPGDKNSDVVGIEFEPGKWSARDNGSGFFIPFWPRTEITVVDARRQMKKSSSVKEDLRRIRKHQITCESSTNEADIQSFYEDMYLPYIRARHGVLSLPDSLEVTTRTVSQGTLIIARQPDGTPIGGITLGRSSEGIHARSLGLISSDKAVMNTGVISALYLACIDYADACGFDRVLFGAARPFLNDGLLRFKKKWGMRLLGEYRRGGVWLKFNRIASPIESFLINNPFLHLSKNKLYGVTFITNPDSLKSEDLQQLHTRYYLPGMNSLQICTLGSGQEILHIPEALQADLVAGTDRKF